MQDNNEISTQKKRKTTEDNNPSLDTSALDQAYLELTTKIAQLNKDPANNTELKKIQKELIQNRMKLGNYYQKNNSSTAAEYYRMALSHFEKWEENNSTNTNNNNNNTQLEPLEVCLKMSIHFKLYTSLRDSYDLIELLEAWKNLTEAIKYCELLGKISKASNQMKDFPVPSPQQLSENLNYIKIKIRILEAFLERTDQLVDAIILPFENNQFDTKIRAALKSASTDGLTINLDTDDEAKALRNYLLYDEKLSSLKRISLIRQNNSVIIEKRADIFYLNRWMETKDAITDLLQKKDWPAIFGLILKQRSVKRRLNARKKLKILSAYHDELARLAENPEQFNKLYQETLTSLQKEANKSNQKPNQLEISDEHQDILLISSESSTSSDSASENNTNNFEQTLEVSSSNLTAVSFFKTPRNQEGIQKKQSQPIFVEETLSLSEQSLDASLHSQQVAETNDLITRIRKLEAELGLQPDSCITIPDQSDLTVEKNYEKYKLICEELTKTLKTKYDALVLGIRENWQAIRKLAEELQLSDKEMVKPTSFRELKNLEGLRGEQARLKNTLIDLQFRKSGLEEPLSSQTPNSGL